MATRNHTRTFKSVRDNIDARLAHKKSQAKGTKMPLATPSMRRNSAASINADFHRLEDGGMEAGGGDIESNGVYNNNISDSSSVQAASLPPLWVDVVDDIHAIFKEIEVKLDRLAEAHKARLIVRFDDRAENQRDLEISQLTKVVTNKIRDAEAKIKAVATAPNGEQDAKVRHNIQVTLATRLQQLSATFRKAQKAYLGRMNQFLPAKGLEDTSLSSSDPLTGRTISVQEMQSLESTEAMVRAREEEIVKIAKNIEELSVIFKELAFLVIEQGTMLDRIDHNMDLVVERVEKGVLELEIADKYSKSNRANYCIGILVLLIVIFLGNFFMPRFRCSYRCCVRRRQH